MLENMIAAEFQEALDVDPNNVAARVQMHTHSKTYTKYQQKYPQSRTRANPVPIVHGEGMATDADESSQHPDTQSQLPSQFAGFYFIQPSSPHRVRFHSRYFQHRVRGSKFVGLRRRMRSRSLFGDERGTSRIACGRCRIGLRMLLATCSRRCQKKTSWKSRNLHTAQKFSWLPSVEKENWAGDAIVEFTGAAVTSVRFAIAGAMRETNW